MRLFHRLSHAAPFRTRILVGSAIVVLTLALSSTHRMGFSVVAAIASQQAGDAAPIYGIRLPAGYRDWAFLPQIQTPVQIIAGRRDTVVPPVNAEYLHERLPHSELHLLDAGHFVWEDAADEYAALLNA